MSHILYPDEYLNSTYEIPFENLYQMGYRGVLFDVDNTLVPHGAPADERAKKLFERLRTLRKKIADEKGIPAFIVFTDVTLRHMCKIKPVTKDEFITVSGVGGNKLQLYGEIFTKEIRNYLNLLK